MTNLSRSQVVKITRIFSRSLRLHHLHQLVYRPPRKGMSESKASCFKSQGSVKDTKTYLTFLKCGKNNVRECLLVKEGCFGSGQPCHMFRDCLSRQCQ